ncbi:MAG: hypothetical protein HQL32_00765 [Planctomycetes bacterium]|nr:hypothetical protein [Planctomycetota bacterium]
MSTHERRKLNKKISDLQKEIRNLGPLMRGSVTYMGKRNKQPYFSVGIQKKTRVIYLGDKRAEKASEYVENYRRMLEIVDEMTLTNMELFKLDKSK